VPLYSIPFRCLYSVNIDNLLFAGRHVSVTHIVLGSVRVQATLSVLGQAAGTAAAMCVDKSWTPRAITQKHISALQQQLLKDDCYIPELKNEDSTDFARTAVVVASSTRNYDLFDKRTYKPDTKRHPLNMERAVMFRNGVAKKVGAVRLLLKNTTDKPLKVKLHLRGAVKNQDFSSKTDIAVTELTMTPGRRYVKFVFNAAVIDPFMWFFISKTDGLEWELKKSARIEGCRAYGNVSRGAWRVVHSQQYAAYLEPGIQVKEDYFPESVIDGVARIVGSEKHCWVSEQEKPFPQWIELDFKKPVKLSSVRLTFDTELNVRFPAPPVPRECVKDYKLSVLKDGKWVEVADVKDNFMRHCVHEFKTVAASKVRLTVEATHGDPSARVFEIRVY